jgi:hypothetical protein
MSFIIFAESLSQPETANRPTLRISKKALVEALIRDFVTEIEAHAAKKRDWLKNLAFVTAERQFFPQKPDRSDFDDDATYHDAFREFVRECLKGERPYPEPVAAHAFIGLCVGPDGKPDFEIIDDLREASA